MTGTASGREGARKAYADKVQAKAQSSTTCAFCWFVLQIYPTLTGMTDKDTDTYREHLRLAHALKQEISV
ncbi:MAG TPA: hypothetical protein VLX56_06555 [Nitrososphaerales archaeon]|nr:hypothetical protein [Nitrososphaerales archaeon]